jgi:hypothetical protein
MRGWRRRLLVAAAMVGLIGVLMGGVPTLRAGADAVMYNVVHEQTSGDGIEFLQQQGCPYGGTITDGSGQPIAGVTVTVVETGATTQTDATGRYQVTVPGPGTWTVRITRDGFMPRLERILFGPGCVLLSSTDISGSPAAGTVQPTPGRTPTPARTPTATPTPALSGAVRLTGTLTIEGRPAAAGTTLQAMIGETVCGLARTNAQGRYSMDVASDAATRGCGVGGADVQIVVTPGFGSGWYVGGELRFQPNAMMQRDLSVDLRKLPADPLNVPWNGSFWTDMEPVPIGICAEVSAEAEEAIQAAYEQWYQANRIAGLRYDLVPDGDAACGLDRPGIGFLEGPISMPGAIAGAFSRDANFNPCSTDQPCYTFKSVVRIDPENFLKLSPRERANVLAHEIGHALGLGHAERCNGGTIMWFDTACRYPLTHIGVDDIASLNEKAAAIAMAAAPPSGIEYRRIAVDARGDDGDAPPLGGARAGGSAAALTAMVERGPASEWVVLDVGGGWRHR